MDRLGLGYEDAPRGRTRCSSTARSPGSARGAGAELPGYDLLVQALGGLMSITGEPDGEPQKVGVALVDVLAGLFATVGILAALRHRDAHRRRASASRSTCSPRCSPRSSTRRSAYTLAGGVVPARMGNAHPSIAPYELLRGARRRPRPRRRQRPPVRPRSATIAGAPGLADDERFATNAGARRATATRSGPSSRRRLAARAPTSGRER